MSAPSSSEICTKLNSFVQNAQMRGCGLTIQGWGTTTDVAEFKALPLTNFVCRSENERIVFKFPHNGKEREFSLKPTAHGIDSIDGIFPMQKYSRIWVHDSTTLNDLNIVEY